MDKVYELYPILTEAIRKAEILDDLKAPGRADAYLDVSLIEEKIATILPAIHEEGALARRGAVRAAIRANDFVRAEKLGQMYLQESQNHEKLREPLASVLEEISVLSAENVTAIEGRIARAFSYLSSSRDIPILAADRSLEFETLGEDLQFLRDRKPGAVKEILLQISRSMGANLVLKNLMPFIVSQNGMMKWVADMMVSVESPLRLIERDGEYLLSDGSQTAQIDLFADALGSKDRRMWTSFWMRRTPKPSNAPAVAKENILEILSSTS